MHPTIAAGVPAMAVLGGAPGTGGGGHSMVMLVLLVVILAVAGGIGYAVQRSRARTAEKRSAEADPGWPPVPGDNTDS